MPGDKSNILRNRSRSLTIALKEGRKNLTTAAILAGIVLLTSSCTTPNPDRATSVLEWDINLDQPIEQLEEELEKLEQQQPRNYTVSNVAFVYDAKLYILFREFIDKLPEDRRATEIREQKKWLVFRKAQIDDAYAEYEGGTFASFAAGRASIEVTWKRIVEIERKSAGISGESEARGGIH